VRVPLASRVGDGGLAGEVLRVRPGAVGDEGHDGVQLPKGRGPAERLGAAPERVLRVGRARAAADVGQDRHAPAPRQKKRQRARQVRSGAVGRAAGDEAGETGEAGEHPTACRLSCDSGAGSLQVGRSVGRWREAISAAAAVELAGGGSGGGIGGERRT